MVSWLEMKANIFLGNRTNIYSWEKCDNQSFLYTKIHKSTALYVIFSCCHSSYATRVFL